MRTDLSDPQALRIITPEALSWYALTAGWKKRGTYGAHADLYAGTGLPEIILPKDVSLSDYPNVVGKLIEVFATVAHRDKFALYRSLLIADRDAVRVRVHQETLNMNDGIHLISASRDLLLATAYSLRHDPQPFYYPNKDARDLVSKLQLGHTEPGSFVVTLLTPVLKPGDISPLLGDEDDSEPDTRQLTRRLSEALDLTRQTIDRHTSFAMSHAISSGLSSNLCDALSQLIAPFRKVSVRVSWAVTRPLEPHREVRFEKNDTVFLGRSSQIFREQKREDSDAATLEGFVKRLNRDETESGGVIQILTFLHGSKKRSTIEAILTPSDYETAIEAHREQSNIVIRGRIKRIRRRYRLLDPQLIAVVREGKLDL